MKTIVLPKRRFAPHEARKAFALVLVLSVLSLLTMLIVGLMSQSITESRGSRLFDNSFRLSNLRDSAANLVIAQIRSGTSNLKDQTWASQPGAIRIYGIEAGSEGRSSLAEVRKLYSSAAMVEGSDFNPANELPPEDWKTKTGLYVDLNEVRAVGNGTEQIFHYPILDPKIVDEVEGVELPKNEAGEEDASMPVAWLYVLKDGKIATPTGQNGDTVEFDSTQAPSADNPIVGRIAFWTDDDSSKVNLNTASEGVHWDHPIANTKTERGDANNITQVPNSNFYGYASSLPQRGEFARYPGHPAETSLSPILKTIVAAPSERPSTAHLEQFYQITPRVALGGSRGGTVQSYYTNPPHPQDTDRLFTSIDEVLFKHPLPGNSQRPLNTFQVSGKVLQEKIDRLRFLATTNSRSPELTPHGTPKVTLWPFYAKMEDRNIVDHLMAWCSTVNGRPYYFQRATRSNASQSLASYDASAFSTSMDFALTRNQELYDMLYRYTGKAIPGFENNTFASKYPDDRSSILTSMMDMIRSNFNVFARGMKTTSGSGYEFTSLNGLGEFHITPMRINRNGAETKGFGMCPTITEAALVTYATQVEGVAPFRATEVQSFLIFEIYKPSPSMPHQSPCIEVEVEGLEKFQLNDQPLKFPPNARVWWDGNQSVGAWGSFVNHSPMILQFASNDGVRKTTGSGYLKFNMISQKVPLWGGGAPQNNMSFSGGNLTVRVRNHPKAGGRNDEIQTLTLNFPDSPNWPVPRAQSNASLPRTYDQRAEAANAAGDVNLSGVADAALYQRMNSHNKDTRQILLDAYDVVRSVQVNANGPSKGDYRMIAGRVNVPSNYFHPHPNYHDTTWEDRSAHSLRDDKYSAHGMPGWNTRGNTPAGELSVNDPNRPSNLSTAGRLVSGANYGLTAVPPVAQGLTAALNRNNRPGDWENGLGILPDGAFVRRSNESSSSRAYIGGWPQQDSSYYLTGYYYHDDTGIDFAPNRQIASAILLGALPTGVMSGEPWQTLLFAPNPAARTTSALSNPTGNDHKGFEFPRDHLLLEYFWMPAIEPYAISEPCSTAGKVNMNYEMLPFRNIKRRTAMHSVMKSLRMAAIPKSAAATYKSPVTSPQEFRYGVNLDAENGTLRGFEERFKKGDIFRSASEICEIFLVPKRLEAASLPPGVSYPSTSTQPTYQNMIAWWNEMELTGDNTRELPYNHLYPRLTTQSNSYTLHYRVQVLRKARSTGEDVWVEGSDLVEAEQRGSLALERSFDILNQEIPDYATNSNPTKTMNDFILFRVGALRRF